MRRVMEESLKMHEQEEQKRGEPLESNNSNQAAQLFNNPSANEEDYLLECMQKANLNDNATQSS